MKRFLAWLSKKKKLLLLLMTALCLTDFFMSYLMLKFLSGRFHELNPVGRFIIYKFGLEKTLLLICPIFVISAALFIHFAWHFFEKREKPRLTALVGIGVFFAVIVRFCAVSWNTIQYLIS